ncbi:MAG: glycosyltransferase family 9 protein [Chlamydiales bacterium]|nr:glycosyltransferase family 9 protein [Chlamydiales bacterium]
MDSILLVRTSSIGDVVQTFAVAEYLKSRFPSVRIDWVVERNIAPLLRQIRRASGEVLIDSVIEIAPKIWIKEFWRRSSFQSMRSFWQALQEKRYDVVFDLQGNTKSALITLCANSREKVGYGWRSVREKSNLLATHTRYDFPLDYSIRKKYLKLVQTHLRDETSFESSGVGFELLEAERNHLQALRAAFFSKEKTHLMVCAGSRWENKRLQEDTLIALLEFAFSKFDLIVMAIYSNEVEKAFAQKLEKTFQGRVSAVGNLSLPLWQTLMREVDGILAVDSAALHFAATTSTPSFSVFGPTSAQVFKPMEERHYAFQGKCPYGKIFVKQCPILRSCKTGACIRGIRTEELFAPFSRWMQVEVLP